LTNYIEVVDNTTASIFSGTDGYLAMAVMLWGNNPFPNASTVETPMLRVENYNLPTSQDDDGNNNDDEPDYYIVLQMNQAQSFNFEFTLEEVLNNDIENVTFPRTLRSHFAATMMAKNTTIAPAVKSRRTQTSMLPTPAK